MPTQYRNDPAVTATPSRRNALLALALIMPVPVIGIASGLIVAQGPVGQTIFAIAKAWIVLLPVVWLLGVDKGRLSWSPPVRGGFVVGAALGVAIAMIIFAAYWLIGRHWIDQQAMRTVAEQAGLKSPAAYLVFCAYLIVINSLAEEYIWRWFIFRQCELLMPTTWAVLASALSFTLHHIVALSAYFDWRVTVLGNVGIFIGAAFWSACYLRYRSIWPGYVSHAIVDVAVFVIGYQLIFST